MAHIRPVFSAMTSQGLFALIRQLIVAFAPTLCIVPVCTPNQFMLAISYTAHCLLGTKL